MIVFLVLLLFRLTAHVQQAAEAWCTCLVRAIDKLPLNIDATAYADLV